MPTTVVATAYGDPDVLAVVEQPSREPAEGEVTVAVRAIGVNPIDAKLYGGGFGTDPAKLPMPLGGELSGVVTAVGPGVATPSVGDEVVGFRVPGAYASEVTVPASHFVPKPAALSWEVAGGVLLTGGTAVHALHKAGVTAGDTLLVHGASGGVGALTVQLAVAEGATVVGTASPRHHDRLRGYGAIPVAYGDGLADRVRALLPDPPGTVTAAIDAVGTDEAVDTSLELVADRTRIVTMAAFGRTDTGIAAIGGAPGADPGTGIRENAWRTLLPAAAEGTLQVDIATTFPLTSAADAHRLVLDGHAGGKVILLP